MKNVKVIIENGEVTVVGVNKDGSVSKVEYSVVEVVGLKEYGVAAMKAGAQKQYEQLAKASTTPAPQPEVQPKQPAPAPKPQARVKEVVQTKGEVFTNITAYGTRAVKFDIANKGECVIGFAKDRNVFLEAYNGAVKEVTKSEVIRRLSKYKGTDAVTVVNIISGLKPVSFVATHCAACGCEVSHRVKDFSTRHYGMVLCQPCQRNGNRPAPQPVKEQQPAVEQPAPKVAERSEATAPQQPAPKSHKVCSDCGKPYAGSVCLTCDAAQREAERLAYWGETCNNCGGYKEQAFDECETCRDNKWNKPDANQLNLFSENVVSETDNARIQQVVDEALKTSGKPVELISLDDPSIETLSMENENDPNLCECGSWKEPHSGTCKTCDEEAVEYKLSGEERVAAAMKEMKEQRICGCGQSKAMDMHMCEDCTNDAELRHYEKNFANTPGASEASAPETETKVDGDGVATLDDEALGALGL